MTDRVDFSSFTDEELFSMVDDINRSTIDSSALIRDVARRVYATDSENMVQMLGLSVPIATELARRLRERG